MTKIEQAQAILKAFGLPEAQQNEMSALTLLALCGLRKSTPWSEATAERCGVSNEIMAFVNENYKKKTPYAPNTRETFRRHVLHQFVQAAIARYNPDEPNLPVNSPRAHYRLSAEALEVVKAYNTPQWDEKLKVFIDNVGKLQEKYLKERELQRIPLNIDGQEFLLSPGAHNEIQAKVVNEFAARFVPGGRLLYIGDTEDKKLYVDDKGMKALNLVITEHSKLPDIIICDDEKEWLFLIEVVTSHGPISPKRMVEFEELTGNCQYGKVYVTVFPDAKEFRKHVSDIAWETEVWLADSPDHMIHFNGDRFIGPR
ncbi:MAG: restriction endonuclease [Bacteroidales bacterium]|nr:restriction endonuclease [Bacteroidales bacterium]